MKFHLAGLRLGLGLEKLWAFQVMDPPAVSFDRMGGLGFLEYLQNGAEACQLT